MKAKKKVVAWAAYVDPKLVKLINRVKAHLQLTSPELLDIMVQETADADPQPNESKHGISRQLVDGTWVSWDAEGNRMKP